MIVEFSRPVDLKKQHPGSSQETADYSVQFKILYDDYAINGLGMSKFGHNRIFGTTISSSNLTDLEGVSTKLRHRHRSLAWFPSTRIEDQLATHFDDILLFPNIEDWRTNARDR